MSDVSWSDPVSNGKMPSSAKYHDGANDHCGDCADEDSIQSSAGRVIDHRRLLSRLPAAMPRCHDAHQKSDRKSLQGHLAGPPTDTVQGHTRLAGSFDCLSDALARIAEKIGGVIECRLVRCIAARARGI
jgi:hypothetical protein